ncbi:hypothetical protein like AT3G55060 [Hibiscus trionum]|uniref:DUF7653 domain-containing protein n=1 Tax=Hibiscus trionum TaxID=183268 RepID=A0A9W7JAY8_HIBTR|nr:hypothetical protein like AT3G55060 [Hibiscus trionum]
MKKLLFFKSSSSSSGNNNGVLSNLTDKQVYWGNTSESWLSDHMADCSRKQILDGPSFSNGSCLLRSQSLSSSAFAEDKLGQQQQYDHQSRARTPEKKSKAKKCDRKTIGINRPCSSGSSRLHRDSSGSSSCSSNVSSQVIDRYIDGEQLLEIRKSRNSSNLGTGGRRHRPRARYTAPSSPTHSVKEINKSHSFRDGKGISLHFSSGDWVENGFGHESPRMVAKNVIERLSQTYVAPRSSSKGSDHHIPITNEEVFGGYMNRCPDSKLEMDESYKNCIFGGNSHGSNSSETEKNSDVELQRKLKEAEKRVMLLSESHEQESFICNGRFDASSLVRSVRCLKEEKIKLALEVSDLLRSRISERASSREELRIARAEMESKIEKLAKEKHEIQLGFEKEFNKRSTDWSIKLEKYRFEEKRLRDQVQELADQNVSLQREASSFNDKETENRSLTKYSEQQLKELTRRDEKLNDENRDLIQSLSESQEKYRAAVEDVACIRRNLEEKENECKELQSSVTRLLRMCTEQEKTIEGLRVGCSKEIEKKQSPEKNEQQVKKLQMEQMRLTGVELALRKEVESYRLEAYSLRHENIDLLNRLRGNGNDTIRLTFKLDNELQDRVCCLQNRGLSMLNEIIDVSSKLIEFIKGKTNHLQETQPGLESQFVVDSDLKIKGFIQGVESLARTLQTISGLLHEKSSLVASDSHLTSIDPIMSTKLNNQSSEEIIRSELKAETLVTSLLKEKLYSKEVEIEQLQAELAAALRGNEILRCEVQNSMDNISCLTHRLKDLQLQVARKEEDVRRLQSELEERMKEVSMLKGILVKVSRERDVTWEEVKQYNEKSMVLNSEISALRRRIQGLDEDILLKEGQITILKDTLSNYNTFDLLRSPNSMADFLLK